MAYAKIRPKRHVIVWRFLPFLVNMVVSLGVVNLIVKFIILCRFSLSMYIVITSIIIYIAKK